MAKVTNIYVARTQSYYRVPDHPTMGKPLAVWIDLPVAYADFAVGSAELDLWNSVWEYGDPNPASFRWPICAQPPDYAASTTPAPTGIVQPQALQATLQQVRDVLSKPWPDGLRVGMTGKTIVTTSEQVCACSMDQLMLSGCPSARGSKCRSK